MQKNASVFSLYKRKKYKIIQLKMKLITILFLAGTLAVSATSYSRTTKIDLSFRDSTSVADILGSIEKYSEFFFIYDADIVNVNEKRTIMTKGEKIEVVLDKLFQGTNVGWLIDDRQVLLYNGDDLKTPELSLPKSSVNIQLQQKQVVRGIVTDENEKPMPGVNVQVEGTIIGTITDINGKYSIEKPNDKVILIFSFIGYQTNRVSASGKVAIDIKLIPDTKTLEEVVVVGYGIQKKESVVGAITQVNSENLVKSGVASVTNAISGKLSGVLTMQTTGQPGYAVSEIVIRGLSSWNSSAPLVLGRWY